LPFDFCALLFCDIPRIENRKKLNSFQAKSAQEQDGVTSIGRLITISIGGGLFVVAALKLVNYDGTDWAEYA